MRSEDDVKYSTTLFVGGLPYNISQEHIADLFGKSKIKFIKVGMNRSTGHGYGYAFVCYYERKDAEEAKQKYVLKGIIVVAHNDNNNYYNYNNCKFNN